MKNILKFLFPHFTAIVVFLILNCIFFYPQIQGKVIRSGDIISHSGMSKEIVDFKKKTNNEVLWTNAMFGGMPAFQISAPQLKNKIGLIERLFQLSMSRPIGYFNALMIGVYILLIVLGISPWLSIIGAISFAYSSNHFILFEAGHMTKLRAIAQFAPIIAGVLLTFNKKYLSGGVLFAVGMAIDIYANHVQMTYYLGLVLLIYVFILTYSLMKNKDWKTLCKVAGLLSLGLVLAIGSSASKLWTTYEYSKDTMRGAPILQNAVNSQPTSSSEVEGLEWNYAMQWSNGIMDLVTVFIPGAAGGASSEKISNNSAVSQEMRRRGVNVEKAPLYWGSLPFTSGPTYFGTVMFFLFALGFFVIKGQFKWWIGASVLLTMVLSMGKNLEFINHFIYDLLPLYNKFRAPSSILSVTALFIPLFGIFTLSKILYPSKKLKKEKIIKGIKITGGSLISLVLAFAILGPSIFDFSSANDSVYGQQGWNLAALLTDRRSLLQTDSFRTAFFIFLSCALIWLFIKDKISRWIVIVGIGLLSVIDLWTVGMRYLDHSKFIAKSNYQNSFTPRPIDQQILNLEKSRGDYRVLDLSVNTFNSSSTSYYHNTIGGYHAAKLQRYQDIIDRHINSNNISVLNMLNAKYIISQQGQLQTNPNALGPAWFVDQIRRVQTPNEEIDALINLNPSNEAVILDIEFDGYINTFEPSKNGSIVLENYAPNHLLYNTSSNSEQLAVFSEIWYGPDKGWMAYIDGKKAEHVRVNYLLRALRIPAGDHKVEFKFEPTKYYLGENISLASSIIIVFTFFGSIIFLGINQIKKLENSEVTQPNKIRTKKKIIKKKRRRNK